MAVEKMIGLGTTLSVGTSAGSTTGWTVIAGLLSLPGPDGSGDDIDTSTIDNSTNFKTFQRGQVDPGEMNLTMAYGSTDTSQNKLGTFYKSGAITSWQIDPPTTGSDEETFNGYVKSMGRAIEKDGMITRTVGIKVTGGPGYLST